MIQWPAKSEDQTRAYGIDWKARLAGDTIATSSFSVLQGTVSIIDQQFDANSTSIKVSGGTNGQCVIVRNDITTTNGDVWDLEVLIPIKPNICIADEPSTTSKRTLVQMAWEKAGLPGYEFEATAEELFSALRALDGLMSQLTIEGVNINYNFPVRLGESDPDDPSGIPDYAAIAVANRLAFEDAPGMGKTMSPEARLSQTRSWIAVKAHLAKIPQMRLPRGTVRGAGGWWGLYRPFIISVSPTCEDCC